MKMRIKPLFFLPALMAGLGLIPAGRATAQTYTDVYSFTAESYDSLNEADTNGNGSYPSAGLILSGNTLYGTTSYGGTNGNGTVFAVNTDGTGFTVLHTFTALSAPNSGTNSDGANPQARLFLQSFNYLWGTAENGGTNGNGTVFSLTTDGLNFTTQHSFSALSAPFNGTNSDGAHPAAGLTFAGVDTVVGTAQNGGTNGNGTVFAINTDDSSFTTLYTFSAYTNYTNSDGANPLGGLIISSNGVLYGTASGGGAGSDGTVFALNADGTGFTNLYSFTGFSSNTDGANPFAGLVLSGNTLYGTTHSGGAGGAGTVFGVNTNGAGMNGAGFTNLHTFTGGNDGANPYAGLIVAGSTLFGTAGNGGTNYDGTLFSLTTDGSSFTTLHAFAYIPDGGDPRADLILAGNTIYGTAENGGTNGTGMLFSLSLPTPQLTNILSGTDIILTWPTNAFQFALQSTTNLASPTVWADVSPQPIPVVANGYNSVAIPTSSTQCLFYRLSL
jgi:uncharacterized repeat protein (TIGR03803 family)